MTASAGTAAAGSDTGIDPPPAGEDDAAALVESLERASYLCLMCLVARLALFAAEGVGSPPGEGAADGEGRPPGLPV